MRLSQHKRRGHHLIALLLLSLMLWGCGGSDQEEEDRVVIFAASSLTEVMTEVDGEGEGPQGQKATLNFAGTSTLRTQIENGADADLFIAANEAHFKELMALGYIKEGRPLVGNAMVVVVSTQADEPIETLEDLTKAHELIMAAEGVPAGDYAREVLRNLEVCYGEDYEKKVLRNLVSEEANVRQAVAKVAMGEGDAAMVYRTDITEAIREQVTIIDIPRPYNAFATYWVGLLEKQTISEEALGYYNKLFEAPCQQIFADHGFIPYKRSVK